MALIKAKHDIFGVVEVPDTYLELWPDAYKSLDEPEPDDPTDSPPERGEPRTKRTTTTKE